MKKSDVSSTNSLLLIALKDWNQLWLSVLSYGEVSISIPKVKTMNVMDIKDNFVVGAWLCDVYADPFSPTLKWWLTWLDMFSIHARHLLWLHPVPRFQSRNNMKRLFCLWRNMMNSLRHCERLSYAGHSQSWILLPKSALSRAQLTLWSKPKGQDSRWCRLLVALSFDWLWLIFVLSTSWL